jgi:hypothetical protein
MTTRTPPRTAAERQRLADEIVEAFAAIAIENEARAASRASEKALRAAVAATDDEPRKAA